MEYRLLSRIFLHGRRTDCSVARDCRRRRRRRPERTWSLHGTSCLRIVRVSRGVVYPHFCNSTDLRRTCNERRQSSINIDNELFVGRPPQFDGRRTHADQCVDGRCIKRNWQRWPTGTTAPASALSSVLLPFRPPSAENWLPGTSPNWQQVGVEVRQRKRDEGRSRVSRTKYRKHAAGVTDVVQPQPPHLCRARAPFRNSNRRSVGQHPRNSDGR